MSLEASRSNGPGRAPGVASLPLGVLGALLFLAGCDGGAGSAPRVPAPPRGGSPWILVVLVDALRPDHLGSYGYGRPTSPALDRLAARSILFENAYAVSSWTKPAVPSLFTSLYPSQHGVFEGSARGDDAEVRSDVLPGEAMTLAEALRACGYATAAFVHNAQLRGRFGFAQGFDLYEEPGDPAAAMIERFLRWVRERPASDKRPFFAYLHLLDVHWPYEPSPDAARAIGLDGPLAPGDRALREAVNQGLVKLERPQLDAIVSRYDAGIRAVDAAIERLLRALEDLALLEDAVLLVTSDHGEAFLEHGALGHGGDLYEESTRIPLILKLPGDEAAGARLAQQVSSLDVMPTLLDLAGCQPEGFGPMEGRSLAGLIRGETPASGGPRFAEVRHGRTVRQAIWLDGWKLIRTVRRTAPAPPRHGSGPLVESLVGRRLEVEGGRLGTDRFVATEIEEDPAEDQDDEVSGTIEWLDRDRSAARVAGYSVELRRALIQAPDRSLTDPEALRAGASVKMEGRARAPDRFEAKKIRLLGGDHAMEIEGIVQTASLSRDGRSVELEIAGLRVVARRGEVERAIGARGREGGDGPLPAPRVELELYDLGSDPGEKVNLVGRRPDRARSLLSGLEQWQSSIVSRSLGGAEGVPVDKETLRQLKALGYVK